MKRLNLYDEPIGSDFYLTEKGLEFLGEVEDIADLPGNIDISHASKQYDYWLALYGIEQKHSPRIRRVLFNTNKKGDISHEAMLLKLKEGGLIDVY